MKGIAVEYNADFCELFKPIMGEFEELYWLGSFQSWPFDSQWVYENEENQKMVEDIYPDKPFQTNMSDELWLPGTLPKLAPYICFGEYSYLTGLKSNEDNIGALSAEFFLTKSFLSRQYFQLVDLYAYIYIVYVDCWWEIYTTRKPWFDALLKSPNSKIIDSSKWY